MCGIAGLSGVLDRPIAEVMGDVIAHRGPIAEAVGTIVVTVFICSTKDCLSSTCLRGQPADGDF